MLVGSSWLFVSYHSLRGNLLGVYRLMNVVVVCVCEFFFLFCVCGYYVCEKPSFFH